MSTTTLTILMDNTAEPGFGAEFGFSLWIEQAQHRILFDTGQTGLLLDNATKSGINLEQTEFLALSHGHYDHTGGLPEVLNLATHCQVYCHPGAVLPRYSIRGQEATPIHMAPSTCSALDHLPSHRLHWVWEPVQLTDTIGLTGPLPRNTDYEDTGGPFYLDPEGKRPDPIDDDQALWIKTDAGLIVCLGCAHSGLINTLDHIRTLHPDTPLHTIIGGFHLVNAAPNRLQQTCAALQQWQPKQIIACHCTGEQALRQLQTSFPLSLIKGAAGQQFQC